MQYIMNQCVWTIFVFHSFLSSCSITFISIVSIKSVHPLEQLQCSQEKTLFATAYGINIET